LEQISLEQIFNLLPHRYPFLLIDRVVDCSPGKSLVALKNVTINEPFFQGHFPRHPVMPGVLIVEAIAQATGILAFISMNQRPDDEELYYLVGIDKARFKQPVVPGEQVRLEVELLRTMRGIWKFNGLAKVDDSVVTSAELMCAVKPLGA
jgi:3-hydroxyacyl-[acyl-carrier-protein] dehydratase